MARTIYVDLSNSLEAWRQKTNCLSTWVGDLDNLITDTDVTIVDAINSMETKFITETEAKNLFTVTKNGQGTYSNLTYDPSNAVFTYTCDVLQETDIPSLSAAKITTGQFDPLRIPSLDANKINSGVLGRGRIPLLDASWIDTGVLYLNTIPSLPASRTSASFGETFDLALLPTIPISKIATSGAQLDRAVMPSGVVYTDVNQAINSLKTFNDDVTMAANIKASGSGRQIGTAGSPFSNAYITFMSGVAQFAQYADLAEKYLPDEEYEVGTVMMVGGEKEVTAANATVCPVGVISEKPAVLMNSELEGGVPLALVGRVPVKVTDPVKKGEGVYVSSNGIASVNGTGRLVGIALEDNYSEALKLVECILKL